MVGLCRDDIVDDAVAHVELDDLASELPAGITAELQGKAQRSIPHLQDGLEDGLGVLVGQHEEQEAVHRELAVQEVPP